MLDLVSVAPMLDWTDRHFRHLVRLISKKIFLYTEMHTAREVLEDKKGHILTINPLEYPIAIQLGGNDPNLLKECARLVTQASYDEINLNVGCPSARVHSGGMGACLMLEPERVADCVAAMRAVTHLPVTVKCRLGVDEQDGYEHLVNFIDTVSQSGCNKFILHARKAWLKGLSPKQNRNIPPLNYPRVYQLKKDFPSLQIILNGGVSSLESAKDHLKAVDGVMLGRAVYKEPFILSEVDSVFYGQPRATLNEQEVVIKYMDYVENELMKGTLLSNMTRHLMGLFLNKPGARLWRQHLSSHSVVKTKGANLIKEALEKLGCVVN